MKFFLKKGTNNTNKIKNIIESYNVGNKSKLLAYSKLRHLTDSSVTTTYIPVGDTTYQIKGKVKKIKRKLSHLNFGYVLGRKISKEILTIKISRPLL